MSEIRPVDLGQTPTIEVRVYLRGELIDTQLCETIDEATALVAAREETPGVECEVEDLSATTHDVSSAEVESTDLDTGYPHAVDPADRP